MKTKIKIKDSNGLKKAYDKMRLVKRPLFKGCKASIIKCHVKAWSKMQDAIDDWEMDCDMVKSNASFNYPISEPERGYSQRLADGFAMMEQE